MDDDVLFRLAGIRHRIIMKSIWNVICNFFVSVYGKRSHVGHLCTSLGDSILVRWLNWHLVMGIRVSVLRGTRTILCRQ